MSQLYTPAPNGRPKPRRDVWPYAPPLLTVFQVLLRLVPEMRLGKIGVVCWYFGLGLVPLIAWVGLAVAVVWSLVRRPFWTRRRAIGFALLIALGFSGALFGTYPSSHDGKPSAVAFRLPVDGPVTVGWGGGSVAVNYHVVAPSQRWAYDLLVARDGITHKGDGSLLTDYYSYNLPVLAPAAGTVVEAFDADPDMPPGKLGGGTTPAGNHAVIAVAPGEYLWVCHLRPGSLTVKTGDKVVAGQPIGRLGNSGNTSEPHVHVHLQDSTNLIVGEGIPMPFDHYRTSDGTVIARGIPTGGIRPDGKLAGQVVENVASGEGAR